MQKTYNLVDFIRAYYNYEHNGTATQDAQFETITSLPWIWLPMKKDLSLNCETANYAVRKIGLLSNKDLRTV